MMKVLTMLLALFYLLMSITCSNSGYQRTTHLVPRTGGSGMGFGRSYLFGDFTSLESSENAILHFKDKLSDKIFKIQGDSIIISPDDIEVRVDRQGRVAVISPHGHQDYSLFTYSSQGRTTKELSGAPQKIDMSSYVCLAYAKETVLRKNMVRDAKNLVEGLGKVHYLPGSFMICLAASMHIDAQSPQFQAKRKADQISTPGSPDIKRVRMDEASVPKPEQHVSPNTHHLLTPESLPSSKGSPAIVSASPASTLDEVLSSLSGEFDVEDFVNTFQGHEASEVSFQESNLTDWFLHSEGNYYSGVNPNTKATAIAFRLLVGNPGALVIGTKSITYSTSSREFTIKIDDNGFTVYYSRRPEIDMKHGSHDITWLKSMQYVQIAFHKADDKKMKIFTTVGDGSGAFPEVTDDYIEEDSFCFYYRITEEELALRMAKYSLRYVQPDAAAAKFLNSDEFIICASHANN